MDDESDDEYIACKVVLLGESAVGKTSIISRYVTNSFSEFLMSTTGATYANKKVEIDSEHKIKFQIWDTGGQERFRSLARIFYQNTSVAILVYDITRKETFDKLKDFWIGELKENSPQDIILAIVGNKSDLYENEQVSLKEGQELAQSINAIFMSTSALSASGIEELFKEIAHEYISPGTKKNQQKIDNSKNVDFSNTIKLNNNRKKTKSDKGCC